VLDAVKALAWAVDCILGAIEALLLGACRLLRMQPVFAASMVWSAASQLAVGMLKAVSCMGAAAFTLLTGVLALVLAPLALLASVVQLAAAITAACSMAAAKAAGAAAALVVAPLAVCVCITRLAQTSQRAARPPAAVHSATAPASQRAQRVAWDCPTCPICMDTVQPQDAFTLGGCKHQYCTPCLLQYARLRFEAGRPLQCAICRATLPSHDTQTLRLILS
jgi:hypothetical protein